MTLLSKFITGRGSSKLKSDDKRGLKFSRRLTVILRIYLGKIRNSYVPKSRGRRDGDNASNGRLANQNSRPDIRVNVPPEVFTRAVVVPAPYLCAAYCDQNYPEGAVIKWKASCSSASVTKNHQHRIR